MDNEDPYGKILPPEYYGESVPDEDNERDITKDRRGFYESDAPEQPEQGLKKDGTDYTAKAEALKLDARKEAVGRIYRADYPSDDDDAYFKALDRLARWLSGEDEGSGQDTPA